MTIDIELPDDPDGINLSGQQHIVANVAPKPLRVEFYIDEVLVNTDSVAPYVYLWDTTKVKDGTHTVRIEAIYKMRHSTAKLALTVKNTPIVPSNQIYWGARIDGASFGGTSAGYLDAPFVGSDASVNLFESHTGKRVSTFHFGNTTDLKATSFPTSAMANARSRGGFCVYTMSATTSQITDLKNNSDANGVLTFLDTWAAAAQSQGYPLMVRPFWEMNGNFGYGWQTNQGISAADYIAAWRTFHDRINASADCVSFFWCPNQIIGSSVDPTPWYPGDSYVDWLGFDAYSRPIATSHPDSWTTNATATYTAVCALNSTKPLAIGEVACLETNTSSDKPNWITDFLQQLPNNFPRVRLMLWYNWNNGTDIASGPDSFPLEATSPTVTGGLVSTPSAAAFAAGIASSYYMSNIVNSTTFPSHTKVPVP